uniref:Uncharacterized protein n=1 Tax=Arundo donax TaxID=35708 RepID=A0A0A9CSQ5_ARUDO
MPQKGQSGTAGADKSSGSPSRLESKGDAVVVKNDSGSSLSTIPPQQTQCHTGCRTEHKRIDALHLDSLCLVAGLLPLQMATSGDSK